MNESDVPSEKSLIDRGKIGKLLAMLEAGADEQSFGATGKIPGYAERRKRQEEEHPILSPVGRAASYLVPFNPVGEAGSLVMRGGQAIGKALPYAERLAQAAKLALENYPKAASALIPAVKGAVAAPIYGTTNALARKAVQQIPGDNVEKEKSLKQIAGDIPSEAKWGGGFGMLGKILQAGAPGVYEHPALVNPNNLEQTTENAKEMMNQGLWGSLKGTFKPEAERLKGVLEGAKQELIPKAIQNEQRQAQLAHEAAQAIPGYPRSAKPPRGAVPVSDVRKILQNKVRDALGNSTGEDAAALESGNKAIQNLSPDEYGFTTIGDLNRNAKLINTDIKNSFSGTDKGKGFGDLDGTLSAKKNRLMDLKQAHGDVMDQALDQNLEMQDLAKLEGAKESYGKGRNLEDTIHNFERGEAGGNPDFGHAHTKERFASKLFNKSIGTAPIRTGIGVIMNKSSPEKMGGLSGLMTQLHGREENKIEKSDIPDPSRGNYFLDNLEKSAPAPKREQPASAPENPKENYFLDLVGQ